MGIISSAMEGVPEQSLSDWAQLSFLKKKLRIHLYAVSLSEYVKVNRIPRGLHIQKAPVLFGDCDDFKV